MLSSPITRPRRVAAAFPRAYQYHQRGKDYQFSDGETCAQHIAGPSVGFGEQDEAKDCDDSHTLHDGEGPHAAVAIEDAHLDLVEREEKEAWGRQGNAMAY